MKNFIFVAAFCLFSTSVLANDCCSNTPVRSTVSAVTNVTKNIVSAPFRLTRKVVQNSRARRAARQYARNCCATSCACDCN
jgi:hypothetical protein